MEHYSLIKYLHLIPAALLLVGVAVHLWMLWRAQRSGDTANLSRRLERTRRYSLPTQLLVAISLPISGWAMVHLAGWPLGQLWLLLSSGLLIVLVLVALLLRGQLGAWQNALEQHRPTRQPLWSLISALLCLALLVAVFALMGAKPV